MTFNEIVEHARAKNLAALQNVDVDIYIAHTLENGTVFYTTPAGRLALGKEFDSAMWLVEKLHAKIYEVAQGIILAEGNNEKRAMDLCAKHMLVSQYICRGMLQKPDQRPRRRELELLQAKPYHFTLPDIAYAAAAGGHDELVDVLLTPLYNASLIRVCHGAALSGRGEFLETLLKRYENAKDYQAAVNAAAYAAAAGGHVALVTRLLNNYNGLCVAAIMGAAEAGNEDMIGELKAAHGSSAHDGYYVAKGACQGGRYDIVEKHLPSLENDADKIFDLYKKAIIGGHLNMVKKLLGKCLPAKHLELCLLSASHFQKAIATHFLTMPAGDRDSKLVKVIEGAIRYGREELKQGLALGLLPHHYCVELLVQHPQPKVLRCAIHIAAYYGEKSLVQKLLIKDTAIIWNAIMGTCLGDQETLLLFLINQYASSQQIINTAIWLGRENKVDMLETLLRVTSVKACLLRELDSLCQGGHQSVLQALIKAVPSYPHINWWRTENTKSIVAQYATRYNQFDLVTMLLSAPYHVPGDIPMSEVVRNRFPQISAEEKLRWLITCSPTVDVLLQLCKAHKTHFLSCVEKLKSMSTYLMTISECEHMIKQYEPYGERVNVVMRERMKKLLVSKRKEMNDMAFWAQISRLIPMSPENNAAIKVANEGTTKALIHWKQRSLCRDDETIEAAANRHNFKQIINLMMIATRLNSVESINNQDTLPGIPNLMWILIMSFLMHGKPSDLCVEPVGLKPELSLQHPPQMFVAKNFMWVIEKQKRDVIALVSTQNKSAAQVAALLQLDINNVNRWVAEWTASGQF